MFEDPKTTLQSLFWNIQGLGNLVFMWEHYSGSHAAWLEEVGQNIAWDLPVMLPQSGSAAALWVTLHDKCMLEQPCSVTSLILWDACGLGKINRDLHFQVVEDCFSIAVDNHSDSMPCIYLWELLCWCLTLGYLIQYFLYKGDRDGQRAVDFLDGSLPGEDEKRVLVHKWAEVASLLTVKFSKTYLLISGGCLSTPLIISLMVKWFYCSSEVKPYELQIDCLDALTCFHFHSGEQQRLYSKPYSTVFSDKNNELRCLLCAIANIGS